MRKADAATDAAITQQDAWTAPVCRHCKQPRIIHKKGLCERCLKRPGIRRLYSERFLPEEREKLQRLVVTAIKAGLTLSQAGDLIGVTKQRAQQLYRMATKANLQHRKGKRRPVPAEAIALLGTISDGEVARRFGFAPTSIRERRIKLGIPCFKGVKASNASTVIDANSMADWSLLKPARPAKCKHGIRDEFCAICEKEERARMVFVGQVEEEGD